MKTSEVDQKSYSHGKARMTALISSLVLTLIFFSLTLFTPSAARAQDVKEDFEQSYISDAIKAFDEGSSYVYKSDANLPDKEKISEAFADRSVYIFSINKDELDGLSPQTAAEVIYNSSVISQTRTNSMLILVELDGDKTLFYPVSKNDSLVAWAKDEINLKTSNPSQELIIFSEKLDDFKPVSSAFVIIVFFSVLGIILACFALTAGIGLTIQKCTTHYSNFKKKRTKAKALDKLKKLRSNDAVSSSLRRSILQLEEIEESQRTLAPILSLKIQTIVGLFDELLLTSKNIAMSKHQESMIYVEFENIFSKLVEITGPNYFQDIQINPNHWANPQKLLKDVYEALDVVQNQISDRIIEIKTSSEFKTQSSVDSILSSKGINAKDLLDSNSSKVRHTAVGEISYRSRSSLKNSWKDMFNL